MMKLPPEKVRNGTVPYSISHRIGNVNVKFQTILHRRVVIRVKIRYNLPVTATVRKHGLQWERRRGFYMVVMVRSLGLSGITGYEVNVESFLAGGLPAFDLVGLPDAAVKEARERVRAAVKNCGATFPTGHITVNLAPAGQRKAGTIYDLPIFTAILSASEELPLPSEHAAFLGELSLGGTVRGVTGVLPMAIAARGNGVRELFVPADNAAEATLAQSYALTEKIPGDVPELTVYGVRHVRELVDHLRGVHRLTPEPAWTPEQDTTPLPDMRDVMGQEQVKRALEIAAAGSHNILLIGSPGAGKSMLAKRLPSILPELTPAEALETSGVWSVAGLTDPKHPLLTRRPFRSPHHTASTAAMAGGGANVRPGEISLAHNGVLFLDELPEFHRDTLESLRQPIEDGEISIARSSGTVRLPARFQLVCAMNPCRCGWRGHPSGRCSCSVRDVERYVEKISGPLLDRIDLHVSVPSVEYEAMKRRQPAEPSSEVKKRVDMARNIQAERFTGSGVSCNAYMTSEQLVQFCRLDAQAEQLMENAFRAMGLSARSHDRILRVARTIADLSGTENIMAEHLAEAIQYRNTDILKG